mgnify:CR=1 FL=1
MWINIIDWASIVNNVIQAVIGQIPVILAAIILFVIGWFVALIVGGIVRGILKQIKIDRFFEKTGWKDALEKAEIKITFSAFLGEVIRWILVIIFLLASVDILGFKAFADFLKNIVNWLPNLIVAIVIFIVAIIIADILEKIVKASVKRMSIGYVGLFGGLVKGAIYVFAFFAILLQLGIASEIVNALVFGLIATLSLALGLSFGLGGKEVAAKIIQDIYKKISEK